MTAELEDINDFDATAAYLKVKPSTLRGLVARKSIGYLKQGRVVTFPREAVEEYVKSRTTQAVAPNPFGLTDASLRRLRAS